MKNNKGFTLIEILTVIIILGIIMIIAVPAVSKYISESKDTTYIKTVNKYIDEAINEVTALEYSVGNKDYTYYIPTKCLPLENDAYESPYDKFEKSYVVVTYNNGKNDYYYTGYDKTGHGILLTYRDYIDESSIRTDLLYVSPDVGVGDREYIYIYSDDCDKSREKVDKEHTISERGQLTEVISSD